MPVDALTSSAASFNRQSLGTDNRAQQSLDAASTQEREDAADSQPTSTAGVTPDRPAVASQPTTEVTRTADTSEQQGARPSNTIEDQLQDQASDLARRQAEARTNQESLGNFLDTAG